MKRFSIVGAGRLGTALGAALARRGWLAEAIEDRDARAARESRRIIGRGRASTSYAAAARSGRGGHHRAPADTPSARSPRLWPVRARVGGRPVFHTSGLVPSARSGPLARRGAWAASLHPCSPSAEGRSGVGLQGHRGDRRPGRGRGRRGDRPRASRPRPSALGKDKPLYHAACALASERLCGPGWTAVGSCRGLASLKMRPSPRSSARARNYRT
jgi:hypothetical protein